jgi:hypothetical protein
MAALRKWKVEVEMDQHHLVLALETNESGGVSDTLPLPILFVANQNQLLAAGRLDQHLALDEYPEDMV